MRSVRLFLTLGLAALGCDHDEAPRCRRDEDCGGDRVCEPAAGICVRMTTPLDIDASLLPDAPPRDATADDATADGS